MIIELHILQNFAPSNLNRDDTGSPKDARFGGYRRARISSQCLKRAARTYVQAHGLLADPATHSLRTKRLVDAVVQRLAADHRADGAAGQIVNAALTSVGLSSESKKVGDDVKSQYLLFVAMNEIAGIAELVDTHWASLKTAVEPVEGKAKKAAKGDGGGDFSKAFGKVFARAADGIHSPDIALFGRMLADLPAHNINAACQVAHALSTTEIKQEFDYYTAVDDLKPDDNAGADMVGTIEFNSACYYRYSVIDYDLLRKNLKGNADLAEKTVKAYIEAAVCAVPTGKQNSFAARNPPSYVRVIVRENGEPWNLANAFVEPVRPKPDSDVIQQSVAKLKDHFEQITRMYGDGSKPTGDFVLAASDTNTGSLSDLIANVSLKLTERAA